MKNHKISVIIPAYNAEKTLRGCLESVLNQADKFYELIVVDNNSTDGTKDIIREFQKKDIKVKYVFEPNRGRGAARNAGVSSSSGDIIAMTDSDCIVPPNWLELLTCPILRENETAVMGSETDLTNNYWSANTQKAASEFLKKNSCGKYICMTDTKNFAVKTPIMKNLMFDERLKSSEDLDFALRLCRLVKIRFEPSVAVGHNHQCSFTEVVKSNFDKAYWMVKVYKKFKEAGNDKGAAFESISVTNFLKFPLWIVFQFLTKPVTQACFILISELAWRSGIIWGLIKNEKRFAGNVS